MPAKIVEDEFEDAVSSIDHAQSNIGDEDASQCKYCGAQLGKRHLNPRHHCRVCGAACCGQCTPNQLKLDGLKGTARACIQCVATAIKMPALKTELGNLGAQLHSLASAEPTSQPETLEAAVKLIEAAVPLLEAKQGSPGSAVELQMAESKGRAAEQASKAAAEKLESQEAELTREKTLRVSLEAELAKKEKGTAGEELVRSIEQLEAELAREKELRSGLEESQAKHAEELAFHQRAAQAATDALAAAQSGEPAPQANTAQLKRLAAEKSEYERQLRDALNAKEKQVLINAELQATLAGERTAMKELKHGVLCCPVQ
uniref:FYVE-type domain-containing protein n=1 Tax=Noctiluca scintillans TaxID=2966 RepID=A0A7S1A5S4_NOCSC|mmetsp:Transcript_32747/g.87904  ORF Transcript_32747/g.87904 Transcript_32747/m.87904 type:complete len:317 (+) Transcript_32747:51-1001(+)